MKADLQKRKEFWAMESIETLIVLPNYTNTNTNWERMCFVDHCLKLAEYYCGQSIVGFTNCSSYLSISLKKPTVDYYSKSTQCLETHNSPKPTQFSVFPYICHFITTRTPIMPHIHSFIGKGKESDPYQMLPFLTQCQWNYIHPLDMFVKHHKEMFNYLS